MVWGDRKAWSHLVTLDFNADHKPDLVWDLNERPLPFDDNFFDEIHAYEVLEHLGKGQGDWRSWFSEWSEWYRLLKPGGMFFGTSPGPQSPWLWGDPSHTRAISLESLVFIHQPSYTAQVGVTPMSDFRFVFQGDFEGKHFRVNETQTFEYIMEAVKPSRITL